ncbi:MAG: HypC/HybG/HupF family hydrogenase formation chaperone [Lysobacter sp.]|nr:HypC/HybG/HupF family hydrogenase formation chaperone [Lysobacter sp.]
MCLGIPMQVVEVAGTSAAWCTGRNGRSLVDMTLVGPQVPGTWLLTFVGSAREVMAEEAAARVDAALDALNAVLEGDTASIDAAFADLVSREPTLPEHLRPSGEKGSDPFSAEEKGSDPFFRNQGEMT